MFGVTFSRCREREYYLVFEWSEEVGFRLEWKLYIWRNRRKFEVMGLYVCGGSIMWGKLEFFF